MAASGGAGGARSHARSRLRAAALLTVVHAVLQHGYLGYCPQGIDGLPEEAGGLPRSDGDWRPRDTPKPMIEGATARRAVVAYSQPAARSPCMAMLRGNFKLPTGNIANCPLAFWSNLAAANQARHSDADGKPDWLNLHALQARRCGSTTRWRSSSSSTRPCRTPKPRRWPARSSWPRPLRCVSCTCQLSWPPCSTLVPRRERVGDAVVNPGGLRARDARRDASDSCVCVCVLCVCVCVCVLCVCTVYLLL